MLAKGTPFPTSLFLSIHSIIFYFPNLLRITSTAAPRHPAIPNITGTAESASPVFAGLFCSFLLPSGFVTLETFFRFCAASLIAVIEAFTSCSVASSSSNTAFALAIAACYPFQLSAV